MRRRSSQYRWEQRERILRRRQRRIRELGLDAEIPEELYNGTRLDKEPFADVEAPGEADYAAQRLQGKEVTRDESSSD